MNKNKTLLFATHNKGKLKEVQKMLPELRILGLNDIGCNEEIPETGSTLKENAALKTEYIVKNYDFHCFSDDTGLEIEALKGEPGVYSARYAGIPENVEANIDKVLLKLKNSTNRKARFVTQICLSLHQQTYFFEGICEGVILEERRGANNFGYDPIFVPKGFQQTFAEMSLEEKARVSHRKKAVNQLIDFLKKQSF